MSISQSLKKLFEQAKLETLPLNDSYSYSSADINEYNGILNKVDNSYLVTGTSSLTKLGAINKAYKALEGHVASFYSFNEGLNKCIEDFIKSGLSQSMHRKEDEQSPLKAFVLNDGKSLILNQNNWQVRLEKDGDVLRGIQGPNEFINGSVGSVDPLIELSSKDCYSTVMESFVASTDANLNTRVIRGIAQGAITYRGDIESLETRNLTYNEVYYKNGDFVKILDSEEYEIIAANSTEDLLASPEDKLEGVIEQIGSIYKTNPEDLFVTKLQNSGPEEFNQ